MNKFEKTIKGLKCCILRDPDDHQRCEECSYNHHEISNAPCSNRLKADALSLLKMQEPMSPIIKQEMDDICSCIDNIAYCRRCGARIGRLKQNYCSDCGQAVKWDDCGQLIGKKVNNEKF